MPGNEDIKAKMREALERKQAGHAAAHPQDKAGEKVHGPETHGPVQQMHRRKAGGGGA